MATDYAALLKQYGWDRLSADLDAANPRFDDWHGISSAVIPGIGGVSRDENGRVYFQDPESAAAYKATGNAPVYNYIWDGDPSGPGKYQVSHGGISAETLGMIAAGLITGGIASGWGAGAEGAAAGAGEAGAATTGAAATEAGTAAGTAAGTGASLGSGLSLGAGGVTGVTGSFGAGGLTAGGTGLGMTTAGASSGALGSLGAGYFGAETAAGLGAVAGGAAAGGAEAGASSLLKKVASNLLKGGGATGSTGGGSSVFNGSLPTVQSVGSIGGGLSQAQSPAQQAQQINGAQLSLAGQPQFNFNDYQKLSPGVAKHEITPLADQNQMAKLAQALKGGSWPT